MGAEPTRDDPPPTGPGRPGQDPQGEDEFVIGATSEPEATTLPPASPPPPPPAAPPPSPPEPVWSEEPTGDEQPSNEEQPPYEEQPAYQEAEYLDDSVASVVEVGRRDDVAAICGRIDGAPTYAVVLYARKGNRVLSTELGMRRLKRHVDDTGKVVALATRRPGLASRARQVGIAVGPKPERIRWDAAGRNVVYLPGFSITTPPIGRFLRVAVVLLLICGLGFAALAVAPSANIVAYPESDEASITVAVIALDDPSGDAGDAIPVQADDVRYTVDITLVVPTTGSIPVDTARATVNLQLTNPTAETIVIPAGALVTTADGAATFAIQDELDLSPEEAATDVFAVAAERGASHNVAAGALDRFESAALSGIEVTHNVAAAGGATESRPAVSGRDYTTLRDQEAAILSSESIRDLLASRNTEDAVFVQTITVTGEEVDDLPDPGEPLDLIAMTYRVVVSARAIPADELQAIGRAQLAPRANGGSFIPGSITAHDIGPSVIDPETGAISTTLELRGRYTDGITEDAIRSAVQGKSEDSARTALEEEFGLSGSDVDLTPGWAPWLPRLGFRIDVDLRLPPDPDPAEDEGDGGDDNTADSAARP